MASRSRPHYRVKWSNDSCKVMLVSYAGGIKRVTQSGWYMLDSREASLQAAMSEVNEMAGLNADPTKGTSG